MFGIIIAFLFIIGLIGSVLKLIVSIINAGPLKIIFKAIERLFTFIYENIYIPAENAAVNVICRIMKTTK